MTHEELEAYVTSVVGSRLNKIDAIIASEKLGRPKVLAFRCAHSEMYFPADYHKEWGITTGIGMGPDVLSESLDSNYHIAPPDIRQVKRESDIMHPVGYSFAQLDLVLVDEQEFEDNSLILHRDDQDMRIRAGIMRSIQMRSEKGVIAAHSAEFNRIKKGGSK